MAVQNEIWRPDIVEALFKDNEFLNVSFRADEYVLNGKVVHIPQSGGAADVEKNRSVYPGTVVRRADTDISYVLDEYTTDPIHVPNIEDIQVTYSKRKSVINENMANLKEVVADHILYNWAANLTPATHFIKTTGAATLATAEGATGNRKAMTEADLKKMRTEFNKMNVPRENRACLLPSDMLAQLSDNMGDKFHYKDVVNLPTGAITKLYGWTIYERSSVLTVAAANTLKAPGAATAVTDFNAGLFWQASSVELALGDVMMFDNPGRAEYYGDLVSFMTIMGGRCRRTDLKGIRLLREDASA